MATSLLQQTTIVYDMIIGSYRCGAQGCASLISPVSYHYDIIIFENAPDNFSFYVAGYYHISAGKQA